MNHKIACRRIVLIGAPGAGKGTQAKRLASTHQLAHISTGEMLRALVQSESAIGIKVRAQIESGKLVNDELVIALAADRLRQSDADRGYVLDGFPRTAYQAEMLDETLASADSRLDCCIHLRVDCEMIIERISKRSEIECRVDDLPATIRHRLAVFEREAAPLLEYYQRRDLLREVSGAGSLEEVAANIRRVLGQRRVAVS
ncbi:MAG: adenylate kinase [Pirellulales bacterium]